MKLTNEQIEALKDCASVEEILAKAAAAGYELSAEQAQRLLIAESFAELDESHLSSISGGCNSDYHCDICNNDFEGSAPHAYMIVAGKNECTFIACQGCYEANKDNYTWLY